MKKHMAWLFPALATCGAVSSSLGALEGCGPGGVHIGGAGGGGSTTSTTSTGGAGGTGSTGGTGGTGTSTSSLSGTSCLVCPSGYTPGTANKIPVCRAPSGIPRFSNVFLIVMADTPWSTLSSAIMATPTTQAPYLQMLTSKYAYGTQYAGVAHPSLPNYIALTSGSTQGIGCDCNAVRGGLGCNASTCSPSMSACSCDQPNTVMNVADQIEVAGLSWMAYGESMSTPCNTTDSGNYVQHHVPFLYYDDIQLTARCAAHVVDFSNFSPNNAAAYNFIAPNLIHDMDNPVPTTSMSITDGDTWLGTQVPAILAAPTYTQGGLLVIVWDEDSSDGSQDGSIDPIGIFVMSPYAKTGGYASSVIANHYSLLATIEDGLVLPHLGMASDAGAGFAATLADFFPSN
jgi:hypothetical protein